MARSIEIARGGSAAKIRNPWGVLGLTLITLGIYQLFWWYYINRELRDLGRARGVDLGQSPGSSLAAMLIGWIVIIPPFVSIWRTGGRIQGAQELVGVPVAGTKPLFFVLMFFAGVFGAVYGQFLLNQVWERVEAGEGETSMLTASPTHIGDFQTPASAPTEAQRSFGDPSK